MKESSKFLKISAFIITIIAAIILIRTIKSPVPTAQPINETPATTSNLATESMVSVVYRAKPFDFSKEQTSLTQSQLNQHKKLYEGYVNKRNEIEKKLASADFAEANNITYSQFRALKLAETFARNGALLHELYFENLRQSTTMGPQTKALLTRDFGSVDSFKKDLMACAACSRGWAITFYETDTQRLHNYVLEAHNETVPVFTIPIIVIDIYEHAYMIDYGVDRATYLKELWESIDWNVIEKRIIEWVLPHTTNIH